jgi:hypothetical protein
MQAGNNCCCGCCRAGVTPVCFVPDQLLMPFKRAIERQQLLPQLLLELPRALLPLLLLLRLQRHINVLCF